MTESAVRARTLGASIVRRLGMRIPLDPMHQRAQEAFALMQVTAAPGALLQLLLVGLREGWHTPQLQARLTVNLMVCVLMLGALLCFTRFGRVVGSARFSAVGMLLFDLFFAWAYGLRGTPTPYVLSLAIIAVIALVERPRLLGVWTVLFGSVLSFGLLNTPRWTYSPDAMSLASSLTFSLAFFSLFLLEFRTTMHNAIEALRTQAAALAQTNTDLHRTMQERDGLSERLATSQRVEAMGRMAGSIAHDFNNLLTVIRGYADMVAEDTPAGSGHRAEVDHLVKAIARASNVTREVLDFATPRPIIMQPINVAAFVRELSPSLRQLLAPRVAMALDTPTALDCIAAGDRAQLERLLLNLATNARDVTPDGGIVRVSVECVDDRVLCRITDGGPGVPPSIRDRIFEPFFTTKGTTGGTGLGLASAFAIARQHGGTIRVDDAPGGGAEFTLVLPRRSGDMGSPEGDSVLPQGAASPAHVPTHEPAHEPALERAHTAVPNAGRPLDGMHVLLVEDDEALRRLAIRMLERSGALVQACDTSAEAVIHLRSAMTSDQPFHLLVTDLRLPGGSGSTVIDAARSLEPPIAIVAISGFLEDADVADRASRHELSFLPKPFSERLLLDAIDNARRYAVA